MSQHLTAAERGIIESGLLQGNSFAYIGKKLDRSPTTISREVRKRRAIVARSKNIYNDCLLNSHCRRLNVCPDTGCQGKCRSCRIHDCTKYCKDYESCICTELDKPPYVCNGCVFEKTCKKDHAYYSAYKAQRAYEHELSASRKGVRATVEELDRLDRIISPLVRQGQSLNHILANHKEEIGLSEKTLWLCVSYTLKEFSTISGDCFQIT